MILLEPYRNIISHRHSQRFHLLRGYHKRYILEEHLEEAQVDVCHHIVSHKRLNHIIETLNQSSVQGVEVH